MSTLTTTTLGPLLNRLFAEADAATSPAIKSFTTEERIALTASKTEYLDRYGRLKDLWLPVSRETGELLYMLVRATGARTVVEFGTSFGISSLYIAAGLRDNGGGRLISSEFERHWHDIVRLDDIGVADSAIADRALAQSVAQHKSMFFAEKAADKTPIDYEAAVGGRPQLTPSGAGRAELEQDYARMLEDGLLLDEAETFDELLSRCAKIQDKANASGREKRP